MLESCLFCNQFEKGHPRSVHYICSHCVQWLLRFNQAALEQYYESVLKAGLERKAQAIKMFIEKEVILSARPKAKKSERDFNRERSHRVVRHQENRPGSTST